MKTEASISLLVQRTDKKQLPFNGKYQYIMTGYSKVNISQVTSPITLFKSLQQ